MVWRTNFGSFRGMEGVPYGMLEIVAYNFSSKLWTPSALQYLHPMASRVLPPPGGALGANMAFQIQNGGTNANYYCYAGAPSAGSIGGSQKGQVPFPWHMPGYPAAPLPPMRRK